MACLKVSIARFPDCLGRGQRIQICNLYLLLPYFQQNTVVSYIQDGNLKAMSNCITIDSHYSDGRSLQ